MNANQVIGLTLAVSAIVVGACAWYMSREEVTPESTTDQPNDTHHFDHVTDRWNVARSAVNNGEVELTFQDEYYKSVHSEMDAYIREAVMVKEDLREHLHTKNALFLAELV